MSQNYDDSISQTNSDSSDEENTRHSINEEYNQKLRNRINSLRDTMENLKIQLKTEKDNWEKELQQVNSTDSITYSQSDKYITSNEPTNNCSHNLSLMYEDPMDYIHVESKNLQRQIAISNYRRRLLEVESMCNLELMRVKQNVTFLQPLRMMASEWESCKEPNESGECLYPNSKVHQNSIENKTNDLTNTLEIMSNQFTGDMNSLSKISTDLVSTKLNYNTDKIFYSPADTWGTEYMTAE